MNKKILIIDDNEQDRQIMHRFLTKSKYTNIIMAEDGKEGLEKVKEMSPDLIILDVLMPKLNGFEVLAQLKSSAQYSSIPVIILTVKNDSQFLDQGISLGADFYLPKPFTKDNLIEFVKLILN
ncbi:MAG: response regulator [Candidatus Omnitrophica bacterium]|nr:response regulator [Candidatus Omnitrophota bacterium]